jgi:hypothetical protein
MAALDQHVGRGDDTTVWCAENSGVVTDANNQAGILRERLLNGGDQSELAVFRDGDECLPAFPRGCPACCASACRLR